EDLQLKAPEQRLTHMFSRTCRTCGRRPAARRSRRPPVRPPPAPRCPTGNDLHVVGVTD
ncbi:Hypothetical protein SMAX5B_007365, partial [Scophthalmus maximus]